MTSAALTAHRQRLDALFEKVKGVADLELQSHWARYLCILVSGFLETAVQTIYTDYAVAGSNPRVARYARSRLETLSNINMTKVLQVTRAFDGAWADYLAAQTLGARKDAIDSVVANRNRIAHGENVSISYARIKEYYDRVVEVVELIDTHCN